MVGQVLNAARLLSEWARRRSCESSAAVEENSVGAGANTLLAFAAGNGEGCDAETESFHIILGYVIQARADDFGHRKQAPTIAVIRFRLARKSCRFDPTQKLNRELLQTGSLPVQRTGSSHGLGEPQSGNLPGSLLVGLFVRTSISRAAQFEVIPVISRMPSSA